MTQLLWKKPMQREYLVYFYSPLKLPVNQIKCGQSPLAYCLAGVRMGWEGEREVRGEAREARREIAEREAKR